MEESKMDQIGKDLLAARLDIAALMDKAEGLLISKTVYEVIGAIFVGSVLFYIKQKFFSKKGEK